MRKQDLKRTATLGELLTVAASLVDEPDEVYEFERGILALLARTFGVEGMPSDERMVELAERLDWPIGP